MPKPSESLATLRPDIAGSLEEFNAVADRNGFIGSKVLPFFTVNKQAGVFGRIPVEQLLQNKETKRAPGSSYARGKFTFEDDSFACVEHGFEVPCDDREAEMYRDYFDAEMASADLALDMVVRNYEKRVAAAVFNATTFASYTAGVGTEWSTVATAVPITDVDTAVKAAYANSGLWPNALIITRLVYMNLRRCAQVIDAIESGGAGSPSAQGDIGPQTLARIFDLPYVFVAGGTKNAADEGAALDVDPIWDDEYAMIARVCTSGSIKEPGLGRTFHWTGDGSSENVTIETYREESARSEIIRARQDTHEKLLHPQCCYLLSNITA